jgi:hypothetical protein
MADTPIQWAGASGKKYDFYLFPLGHDLQAVAGNYIFSKLVSNVWRPIYIGETENLKDRLVTNLTSHHKYDCIVKEGATHVFAVAIAGGHQARLDLEMDLRKGHKTPCNDQ